MMNNFLTRSVRIQVQNNCKKSHDSTPCVNLLQETSNAKSELVLLE